MPPSATQCHPAKEISSARNSVLSCLVLSCPTLYIIYILSPSLSCLDRYILCTCTSCACPNFYQLSSGCTTTTVFSTQFSSPSPPRNRARRLVSFACLWRLLFFLCSRPYPILSALHTVARPPISGTRLPFSIISLQSHKTHTH